MRARVNVLVARTRSLFSPHYTLLAHAQVVACVHTLLQSLAHVEAVIDFGDDEDDVDGTAVWNELRPRVAAVAAAVNAALGPGGVSRGELVRSGLRVAIVGPPNAGKSSLLNALAERDVAIVSAGAGTTRDVLEVRFSLCTPRALLCAPLVRGFAQAG